jgi:hypothetical protein
VLDEKLCGIMRDGVTGIPTAQLQEQAEELILKLQEAIDSVQEGSAFMIGDVYDPNKKAKPVAFDDEVLKKTGGEFAGVLIGNTGSSSSTYRTRYSDGLGYKDANEVLDSEGNRLFVERITNGSDYKKVEFGLSNNNDTPKGLGITRREDDSFEVKLNNKSMYGEHNKPSGSYTGQGGMERVVNIGGTGVLMIYNTPSRIIAFVTPAGCFAYVGWGVDKFGFDTSATFKNGVFTTTLSDLDTVGRTYQYQVI